MKHLILAGMFLVTWNEWEMRSIKPCPDSSMVLAIYPPCKDLDIYTVELSTHSIRLVTQRDVDLFIGFEGYTDELFPKARVDGIIGRDAFNIKVEEVK